MVMDGQKPCTEYNEIKRNLGGKTSGALFTTVICFSLGLRFLAQLLCVFYANGIQRRLHVVGRHYTGY